MRLRAATIAGALALLATLIVGSVLLPRSTLAVGALPACRYDDVLTSPRGYADWSTTLVDTILRVTRSYVPPDLVSVSLAGFSGDGRVRSIVIDDLRALHKAATAAHANLAIDSAYRSYAEQQVVFDSWVQRYGYARALKTPARPGHSEHQLGVAIDFGTIPPTAAATFGATAAGKWLSAHAWEFGFVMSYPEGSTAVTCYEAEAWHFRYLGRQEAARVHASGLTLREYLWANFTTTVVPPPKTSTGPTIAPLASVELTPTLTASPSPASTPAQPSPTTTAAAPAPTVAPTLPDVADPGTIDPAVSAGAAPAIVVVAAMTFALIIGGAWLASRRRRPGIE